jgi:hypothetical protein
MFEGGEHSTFKLRPKFSLETGKWKTSLEACEDHEGFVGIFDILKMFCFNISPIKSQ